jgi:hypothetical protein
VLDHAEHEGLADPGQMLQDRGERYRVDLERLAVHMLLGDESSPAESTREQQQINARGVGLPGEVPDNVQRPIDVAEHLPRLACTHPHPRQPTRPNARAALASAQPAGTAEERRPNERAGVALMAGALVSQWSAGVANMDEPFPW